MGISTILPCDFALLCPPGHEATVNCVAFQPTTGNALLATASDDHTIMMWNIASSKCQHVVQTGHIVPHNLRAAHGVSYVTYDSS